MWKEKKKKNKKFFNELIRKNKEIEDNKIKEIDRRVIDTLSLFEDKIVDIEKKTLWRICDTEEILKTKINDSYVEECLKSLEERLKRDFGALVVEAKKYHNYFEELRS